MQLEKTEQEVWGQGPRVKQPSSKISFPPRLLSLSVSVHALGFWRHLAVVKLMQWGEDQEAQGRETRNASSRALRLGTGLRLKGKSMSPEKHHVQPEIVLKTSIGLAEELG